MEQLRSRAQRGGPNVSLDVLRCSACFLLSSFLSHYANAFCVSHVTGLEDDANLVLRGEVMDVA